LEQQLKRIQLGISKLQELHQNALVEIDTLKAQNATLQNRLKECEQDSASANKKHLVDGITENSTATDGEKKQMKLKINELVREVDKCIALLNQ
jgi:regulator of replication initiation timing